MIDENHGEDKSRMHFQGIPVLNNGRPFIGLSKQFTNNPLTFFLNPYVSLGPLYYARFYLQKKLVMSGLEANEFIWGKSDLWSYHQEMRVFREELDSSYLLQLDGEAHQKKRHHMIQGFKSQALLLQVPSMHDILLKEINSLPEGNTELRSLCRYLSLCMTSQALVRFTLPKGADIKITTLPGELAFGNSLGFLRHLWFCRPSYQRLKKETYTLIDQMLNEREAHASEHEDILSFILNSYASGKLSITRQEIVYDVFLLLEASSVVGHILLWALLYLYRHPEWLIELRTELSTWEPEHFNNINDWPKLKATILEIERLRPFVPYFTLRPNRDFEYQKHQVHKGTPIIHVASIPHFLPEIYSDPFSFKPERFLGGKHYPAKAQSNFGGGKHYCMGKPLAYIQIPLAIADIVMNYDLSFKVLPSLNVTRGIAITPAEPTLPVQFVAYK